MTASEIVTAALSLAAVVGSIIAVVLQVRGSIKAAKIKAETDALAQKGANDVNAGQLALSIAKDADERTKKTQERLDALTEWWPNHDAWDEAVEDELERLDPTAKERLPARPRPPVVL